MIAESALTSGVEDALRLGCVGIGFTIYPGSSARVVMYEQLRVAISEAKKHGLISVVWSYPRGSSLSKDGETAMDVAGYAAHIAAELGAHIIKVKLPTAHLEQDAAKKVYEKEKISISTLTERVRNVVQCSFNGRRVVIFSGGATVSDEHGLSGSDCHPRWRRVWLDYRAEFVPAEKGAGAAIPR